MDWLYPRGTAVGLDLFYTLCYLWSENTQGFDFGSIFFFLLLTSARKNETVVS